MRRLLGAALTCTVLTGSLAGCAVLGSSGVSAEKFSTAVEIAHDMEFGRGASVACPQGLPDDAGTGYWTKCSVTSASGEKYEVYVTVGFADDEAMSVTLQRAAPSPPALVAPAQATTVG